MTKQELNSQVNHVQLVLIQRGIGFKTTVETKVAKALMLQGPIFCRGELCNVRAKSLGCGVQEVFLAKCT